MAVYYAEIEYTTTLLVRFDFPDGETPTDEDVMYAAGYVDNRRDSYITEEKVNYIEKDDSDAA